MFWSEAKCTQSFHEAIRNRHFFKYVSENSSEMHFDSAGKKAKDSKQEEKLKFTRVIIGLRELPFQLNVTISVVKKVI